MLEFEYGQKIKNSSVLKAKYFERKAHTVDFKSKKIESKTIGNGIFLCNWVFLLSQIDDWQKVQYSTDLSKQRQKYLYIISGIY